MTDMQIMDDSPEMYSGGNSVLNHTNSNMKSSNYYYKTKNASSMKLENVKENTTMTAPDNLGDSINRLLLDPKQVFLYNLINKIHTKRVSLRSSSQIMYMSDHQRS